RASSGPAAARGGSSPSAPDDDAARRRQRLQRVLIARIGALEPDAQVVPRGLAGDGVGVEALLGKMRGQQLRDGGIEQEAAARLRRIGREPPGAGALADGVPGPDRAGIDPVDEADLAAHLSVMADDEDPILVAEAERGGGVPMHVEIVPAVDLPEPRI